MSKIEKKIHQLLDQISTFCLSATVGCISLTCLVHICYENFRKENFPTKDMQKDAHKINQFSDFFELWLIVFTIYGDIPGFSSVSVTKKI